MGVRTPNAAPINHGTGACTLRVPPQARVAQQYSCGEVAFFFVLTGPPVYPADLVSRRFRGESVIRLSLGKL